jgi:hypothetical protein
MFNCKWIALATSLVATAATLPARADDLGKTGQIILSAERLFGLQFSSVANEDGASGDKSTVSRTNVSLLIPSLGFNLNPHEIPRVGLDVSVAGGLTVGAALGYLSSTGKTKDEPVMMPSTEEDDPTFTTLLFAPRVGYVVSLTPLFAFWPRAGITYYNVGLESTNTTGGPNPMTTTSKTTLSGVALDLEAMFVLTPVQHFGITASPIVDIPLSGTQSISRTPAPAVAPVDDKVKFTNYGLSFGVLGHF